MSQIIFQRLIDYAEAGGTTIMNADKGRYIKRESDHDAELMAKAEIIDRRTITRQMRAVMFEYEDRRYFAFFGFASIQDQLLQMPEGLRELDATPGLFAIAVTETGAMIRATPAEIREIVEGEYRGLKGYEGHDLFAIASLFPPVMFFEADVDYTYTANLDRVLGAMVSATYVDGPFALSEDTLETVAALFTDGSEFIPFDNVLQGVLSISWSGFYVELYRCVEQLYPVPRLVDLIQQWSSTQSFGTLADLLQTSLGWRPREDESLIKLIAACPESVSNDLAAAFGILLNEKSSPSEIAGRQVYAMRNGLVHFRGNSAVGHLSDEKWNAVVKAMIALVTATYAEFGEKYHQGIVTAL
ncbi:hypothetical protein [Agrobacterium tumefaciens]|uniref:hypothetical protein n=1 Tax=Agrobacterium tumefaciens TaxID=358 RepID=UPI001CBB6350|nr:hypothetical protein [Agrobacterium tumefaciens]